MKSTLAKSKRRRKFLGGIVIIVMLSNKSLMFLEDLTLPKFQEIVVNGNLGCAGCTQRVSNIISKITGLREYTVDVKKKQVIVKGEFTYKHNGEEKDFSIRELRKEHCCYHVKLIFGSFLSCFFKGA
ncbi:uncharacterized protein LOC126678597 [Mercurialis annua]|uniref:uncharacterized protein LOC126678597 n=1 Tax=Mercurialis annua TaxID=3986 RepID=UPI0024AEA0DB|nr:uncharacterized protein LOC126678597 [Mercurialis annua]